MGIATNVMTTLLEGGGRILQNVGEERRSTGGGVSSACSRLVELRQWALMHATRREARAAPFILSGDVLGKARGTPGSVGD